MQQRHKPLVGVAVGLLVTAAGSRIVGRDMTSFLLSAGVAFVAGTIELRSA